MIVATQTHPFLKVCLWNKLKTIFLKFYLIVQVGLHTDSLDYSTLPFRKLGISLIGLEVTAPDQDTECHLIFARRILHIFFIRSPYRP